MPDLQKRDLLEEIQDIMEDAVERMKKNVEAEMDMETDGVFVRPETQ